MSDVGRSSAPGQPTAARPGRTVNAPAPDVLLGRYRVVRPLKDGHAVRTVLAEDLESGGSVVVKAAALSLLSDTLTLARALLTALQDLHDEGVLHRDVKPSNVLLDDGTPLQRATLIDLGLARTEWLHAGIRDIPAGSVRYMSPEQAGLIERSPDERSDTYSLGAVLFECLAGRPRVRAGAADADGEQSPAVDVETLHSLLDQLGTDDAVVTGLVEEFLSDCSDHIARIGAAIAAGHAQDVARAAHHLKSTTAMFGAAGLCRLLTAAESAARAGSADLAALGPRLDEEFARVSSALITAVEAARATQL